MKRFLPIIILFIAGCAALPSLDQIKDVNGSGPGSDGGGTIKIVFLDVGQGDSTLIYELEGDSILIDAGPPGAGRDVVLPYLRSNNIGELKSIVATHYHEDHISGIPEVIKGEDGLLGTADDNIPTNGVLDRGGEYEGYSPAYEGYKDVTAGIRRALSPGERLSLGAASIDVVAQNGELADGTKIPLEPFDENAASVVLLLRYGDFSFLDAADVTGGGGEPPYETIDIETSLAQLVGDVDVLRVAHHGSKTSTNEAFLDAVTPEAAVISVGIGNDFGHPHREVLDRLSDVGVDVYSTEDGTITISVDENDWSFE